MSSSSTREHVLPGGVETMSILRSSTSSGEIFLVGTAHVSQRSAREVRELVRLVKPTTVCVELCEERLRTMREKIERETRGADGEGTSTGTSDFVRDAVKDFMGEPSLDAKDNISMASLRPQRMPSAPAAKIICVPTTSGTGSEAARTFS